MGFIEEIQEKTKKCLKLSTLIKDLVTYQEKFHETNISTSGKVLSVISQDIVDGRIVRGLIFYDNIPISSSVTFFNMEDCQGSRILVIYPGDLDVSLGDDVTVTGFFHGHKIEKKGIFGKKTITSKYEEPYISARMVKNNNKNRIDLINNGVD